MPATMTTTKKKTIFDKRSSFRGRRQHVYNNGSKLLLNNKGAFLFCSFLNWKNGGGRGERERERMDDIY